MPEHIQPHNRLVRLRGPKHSRCQPLCVILSNAGLQTGTESVQTAPESGEPFRGGPYCVLVCVRAMKPITYRVLLVEEVDRLGDGEEVFSP